MLFPAGANNRIQGTEIDQNPGAGLTDSVIAPIQLGWHFKRADAIAGYSIFAPTGRYEDGASNNTGFGMWGQELSVGTTVYLNENEAISRRHRAELRLSIEEGRQRDQGWQPDELRRRRWRRLPQGRPDGRARVLRGLQDQRRSDRGFPQILIRGKNKTFGLGPEASLALARKNTVYGFLRVAYYWETYARTTTQGSALFIQATFLIKPLKIPTPGWRFRF